MTYKSVWWYPNYVEYGSGLQTGKTWPQVMEQYRRPHALYDLRYYDLPTEEYAAKLYYNVPRLGLPKYRATFRDKPHTVSRHYPNGCPEGKPPGFYGRMYYEDGPPQFKYEGPKQDKLFWLEREPYLPSVPVKQRPDSAKDTDTMRGFHHSPVPRPPTGEPPAQRSTRPQHTTTNQTYGEHCTSKDGSSLSGTGTKNPTKRQTQDGVGYL